MIDPSSKAVAWDRLKNAPGDILERSQKGALRLALALLIIGMFLTSAAVADVPPTAGDLTADKGSPQEVGTTIKWTASASDADGDPIIYRFYLKGPSTGDAWQQVQDWSATNSWDWTPSQAGSYEVNVWIRDGNNAGPDSWDAFKVTPFTVNPAPAPNQPPVADSLDPNAASPQDAGTPIIWTASASDADGDTILYKFFLKGPATSNNWVETRGWDASPTWTWTTSAADAGANQVNVWVRDGNHEGPGGYDSFKVADFVINAPNQPPVADSLDPNVASPQDAGTPIKWTAAASDPDGDPISYKFFLKGPSTGDAWQQVQDWSATNFWDWVPAQQGDYEVNVWVRDGNHAAPDSWDAFKVTPFKVNPAPAANQPPTVTSLTPNPTSPQNVGTPIKWTAAASDPDGDPISYKFFLKGPSTGDAWQQVQDWSATNFWDWVPAQQGDYEVNVWVRDGNNAGPDSWDAFKVTPFTVNPAPAPNQPPTVTSLTPNPASPQNVGTPIKWTAVAYDTDGDPISYRFYLKGPSTGDAWQQVQDWSATNFWDWVPAQQGDYEVNVWVRDGKHAGPDSWDAFKVTPFTVNPAPAPNEPPKVTSLAPDKASPQNAGTTAVWTASATDTDGDAIYYRFFLKGPATSNNWVEKRGWSTTPTWSWTTTAADEGNNQVNVWIRDGNHAASDSWDDFKVVDYVVTGPNLPPVFNSLTPNPTSPQNVGATIRWTADATDPNPGDVVQYKFHLKGPSTGGAWQVVQEWSTKNWWDWKPSQQGDYEVNVWIRDGKHAGADSWDAYKITPFKVNPAPTPNRPPTVTALTPNRPSPQIAGATITWTATASDPDGDPILYRFWMKGPATGNVWKVVRDWSNSRTWTWSTSPGDIGQYDFCVYVRDGKHQPAGRYDDCTGYRGYHLITIRPPNQPPVATALLPSWSSPQVAGSTITWTAFAADPDMDLLFFKFWLRGPATGNVWKVVRDWSNSNIWTWSTSSGDAGLYDVYVYVRDGKHNPPTSYDSSKGYGGYLLTAPVPVNRPPVVTAIAPNRPSPQTSGGTITWTASASDPDGDPILYRFWFRGPSTGNAWKVVQDWSNSRTWTWSSASGDAGLYDVYVYVRDGKHEPATRYDSAVGFGGYQLTPPVTINRPPTVTALSPSRPSPQTAGSTVAWTATASDPDGDPIVYRFWLRGPSTGNAWKVVQDWSNSRTWTWASAPGDAGEYSLYVYVRDGKHEPATRYDSATGYSGYQLIRSWGIYQLTSGDAAQDRPSLVSSADGHLLAYQSWEAGDSYNGDIFLKMFDLGWSEIQKVRATTDPAYQDTPSAIFADGYYYVAYVSDETGNWDIFVKKYDRNLNLIETKRLTTSPTDQDSPSLIRVGSDFYLAYQSWETGSTFGGDIFVERFNSAWTPLRKVRVTNEASYQDKPSIALGADDRIYVAYASDESGNMDVFVRKYDRNLNSLEPKRRITTSSSNQDHPSLIIQNGELDLVYSSDEAGSYDLYLERFNPGWSPIERVRVTGTPGDEVYPSLSFSPSEGILWVAYVLQDGVGGNIFVQPAASLDLMASCWASMDFSATRANSPFTLTVKFYGPSGALTDPTSLRLTWSPADAHLTGSTLRKVSTGTYRLDSRLGSPGPKTFTVSATVGGCRAESAVTVLVA
ncbi:MAG: Y_Y_Y domain protein [Methanosaeta sp. PtaB.Bin087]|nr:MAG: Y_Y_Y domain protein [Methanosaeta sp. PtaB.Bin087]